MNLRSIDLNLLPVFEAIYAERSLTRASQALHVTQPAVSNALGRLRAVFEDPLFIRSGRGVAPTPAAQALIKPVREALARLRAGLDTRTAFDPTTSDRVFNIAMRDVAASTILPVLASRLQLMGAGVRLHCHQVDRHDIPTELAAGRLDFAIDIAALARPDLDSSKVISDPLVCALRQGHPKAEGPLTLKDLMALPHIVVSNRRAGRTLGEDALARLGKGLQAMIRVPHYQPAFHMVMSSNLALIAPLSLARRYDVAVHGLPFDAAHLDLLLFWRRDIADEPALRWARGELIAAAGQAHAAASGMGRQKRASSGGAKNAAPSAHGPGSATPGA